jgi:hypothetical protein
MSRPRSHRPSPALVIACIALFTSLGGTGYAATQVHFGATSAKAKSKRKPAPKYITSSQANKLIAAYIATHHITGPAGPQGPAGANGSNGGEGKTGPQGPGAKQINDSQFGPVSGATIATLGPWTLTLTCSTGTEVKITGPGSFSYTESFGSVGGTATTASDNGTANGFTSDVGNGNQQGIRGFLTSGSTITASGGLIEVCGVVGDAIPAS